MFVLLRDVLNAGSCPRRNGYGAPSGIRILCHLHLLDGGFKWFAGGLLMRVKVWPGRFLGRGLGVSICFDWSTLSMLGGDGQVTIGPQTPLLLAAPMVVVLL